MTGAADSFTGKTVLVTGGGRGTGAAIVRRFAAAGAHVVVNCFHSLPAARELRDDLRAQGALVDVVKASVADPESVRRMFDDLRRTHPRIDVLVNNAAAGALLPLEDVDDLYWQRAFDTNVRGALWCTRAAVELMPDGGAVVNVSSLGSSLAFGNYATVGTSKAALESLTRYLAVEYAPRRIRVNAASGSLVDSAVADLFPDAEQLRDRMVAATPLGRIGTEDELASLVLFLASNEASWVTGQVLLGDGGLSLGAALFYPLREAPAPEPASTPSKPDSTSSQPVPVEPPLEPLDDDAIVVVGAGVLAPGASSPEELWRNLGEERDHFTEPAPDRFAVDSFCTPSPDAPDEEDRSYARRSGYVDNPALHPRLLAELRQGASYERTTLWLRHCLYQALEEVHQDGSPCLLAVGYGADGNQEVEESLAGRGFTARLTSTADRAALDERFGEAVEIGEGVLPHRVGRAAAAGILPERTEVVMLDTACSSALYAVDLGVKALREGSSDMAVCGGAFAYGPRNLVLFSKLSGLSRSGRVRCLDQRAEGVLFSDGAGVVVLKTAGRAKRDGDRVLGVVEEVGLSCDGAGKAIYAPNEDGQVIALERAYPSGGRPDWVIGHVTGTRAGDSTEVRALRRTVGEGEGDEILLTSNKSQIGHTGWAAGAVSLVQALQGVRHLTAPAQRFLDAPIDALTGSGLVAPDRATALPDTDGNPVTVGVSAFGFGGTNAHLVLRSPRAARTPRPRERPSEDDVVVVGWSVDVPGGDDFDVVGWLAGGPAPEPHFGADLPLPSRAEVRLPPAVVRAMDRTQLMLLRAHARLPRDVRAQCAADRDRTGVVVGHMGPTTNATDYVLRTYLGEVERVLGRRVDQVADDVRRLVPASREDSFPGMMANVIAARLASQADYRGLNVTVDGGPDSALDALRTAERYLRHGDLEFAVVAALNGNSTPEYACLLDRPTSTVAEGAFVAVLCRATTAERLGLPRLATIRSSTGKGGAAAAPLSYLGANGLLDVLRAVVTGKNGRVVACAPHGTLIDVVAAAGVTRTRPGWRPIPAAGAGGELGADGVLLVRSRQDLADLAVAASAHVVEADGVRREDVERVVRELPESVRALTVVVDVAGGDVGDLADFRVLHDLVFVAARRFAPLGLDRIACLVVGGIRDGVRHPVSGLFAGLVKSLDRELPDVRCSICLTGGKSSATTGFSSLDDAVVLAVEDGRWFAEHLEPIPPADTGAPSALGPDSVVVAAGGARGLAVECLVALAAAAAPTIYVLGRHAPIPGEEVVPQAEFLRAARVSRPDVPLRVLRDEYDEFVAGVRTAEGVARIARHTDRVRHLVCDLTDPTAVRAAVDQVHAAHGKVDLLINSAGLFHGAALPAKRLADFRAVRDTKLLAYANLHSAFADRAPGHWINFGSLLGVTGWPGESDYCAANEMLACAAQWQSVDTGRAETTIAWPLWSDAGHFADPLRRELLDERGSLPSLSTREGTRLFLAECFDPARNPCVVYTGEVTADHTVWTPEPEGRDLFLRSHRFGGEPVAPAALLPELAARALGSTDRSFGEARFHLPLTGANSYRIAVSPAEPNTVLVTSADPAVGITFAALSLGGRAGHPPEPWPPEPETGGEEVDVGFYTGRGVLVLDGPFRTLRDVRRRGDEVFAAYDPPGPDPFDGAGIPVLLVDALVQAGVLLAGLGSASPDALVPVGWAGLDLHDLPAGSGPVGIRAIAGRVGAFTASGTCLAELRGLATVTRTVRRAERREQT